MEKTEAPTPRRLRKARAAGDVPRSAHLASASVLLVGIVALMVWVPAIASTLADLGRTSFAMAGSVDGGVGGETAGAALWRGLGMAARVALPPLAVVWIAAVLIGFLQAGPVWVWRALLPDLARLSPSARPEAAGRHATELVMQAVRVAVLVGLVLYYATSALPRILHILPRAPAAALVTAGDVAFGLAWRLALAMFLLGLLDYAWQRVRWLQRLKMTRREREEELRETALDPRLRREMGRRHAVERRQGGLEAVQAATAVVHDGAGRAVALLYRPETDDAPKVVARGEGTIGRAIVELARRHRRRLHQDADLTRSLWALEVGEAVPGRLYRDVARVVVQAGGQP